MGEHLEELLGGRVGGGCRGPIGHATRLPRQGRPRVRLNGDLGSAQGTIPESVRVLLTDDTRSSARTMPIHARADTLGGVQVVESVRNRIRAVDPFRVDVAIAVAFIVVAVVEFAYLDPEGHNRGVTVAAAVVALSGLAFRRRDAL